MKKGGLIKVLPHRSGSLTETDADAQKTGNLIAQDFTAVANRYYTDSMTGRHLQFVCRYFRFFPVYS